MPYRIFRYILGKFVSTFLAAVAVLTVLFLMDQASRQVEQLAPLAHSLRDFVLSFLLLVPPLLAYTVPLAFLAAMVWTLEQMKQDREITAILSTGTSPLALIIPFMAASAVVFILSALITVYAGPYSFARYNLRLGEMARRSFLNDLKPGTFFSGVPGTLLLVGGYERESGRIDGLLMFRSDLPENQAGEMILAERGLIQPPEQGSDEIILRLENGTIHPVAAPREDYSSGSFQGLVSRVRNRTPDARLNFRQLIMAASGAQIRSWLSGAPIAEDEARNATYIIELNRRLAMPVTVLLYPFIVFPAAISTGRHGKVAAFSSSLIIFLLTYFLYSVGSRMAIQGLLPAVLGAWLPDLVLLAAGLAVFVPYTLAQRKGRIVLPGARP
ncbi:MAG: LptF/LptG family permease [bacterium]|nr:MAG: LptF/LptG family permease [bacterium]